MKQGKLFPHLRAPDDSYIVVTALAGELPDAAPEQILFTGVGKVNATHVLTRYLERHPEIKTVINYGTDGLICRTQDQFIENFEALDLFEHLVAGNKFNIVDMEAYALAKVCAMMNRDFICYKFVSDSADENAANDWHKNVANGEHLFYDVLQQNHNYKIIQ